MDENAEESVTTRTTKSKQSDKKGKKNLPEKWYRFQTISSSCAILRGSRSVTDKRFKPLSRGKQASASAVVALVFAQLVEPRDWIPGFVDLVLEYGDRLFRLSRARNRFADDVYATTSLLEREFFVADYKVCMCTEPGYVFGNLLTSTVGAFQLNEGLRKFFDAGNSGVLTSQGTSVAVWNHPSLGYFYFDPAPVDEDGKRNPNGFACIIRSSNLDGILEVFLNNMNLKHDSRYCIDKVCLIKVQPIGRGKYQSQNACDITVDKKVLQTINPVEIEENKLDCTKRPPKDYVPAEPSDSEVIQKIPLTIEMTNYEVEAKFASVPLIDQNLKHDRYSYDDIKANVPTTFKILPGDIAILHGWTHELNPAYKGKGAQTVGNCLMALGTKKIQPVRTWLRNTLDEILVAGDAVYAEVKAAKSSLKTLTAADFNNFKFKIEDKKMILDVDLLTVVGTIISKIPTVLNLKQGLEEFFVNNTDGIIECPLLTIAIWKQDDYYYIFDSRSCDVNGMRVIEEKGGKKDKEKEPTAKKVIGKCCTIRFPNSSSLYLHILKNYDSSKTKDRFSVRSVTMVDDIPGIRDWNSFKPAAIGESWVLHGTMNSDDDSFEERTRGLQGLAIPVAVLVTAKILSVNKWSKDEVDDCIIEGDAYFKWCMPRDEEEEDESLTLAFKNLRKIMYYKKRKAQIEMKDSCIVGDMDASMDDDILNLEKAVKVFFEECSYGIVEANNKFFGIWKYEEELKDKSKEMGYYLFLDRLNVTFIEQHLPDSKITDPFACVLRFLDVDKLIVNLKDMLQNEEDLSKSAFYIHDVKLASIGEPMSDEDIEKDKAVPIKPELRAYSAMGDTGAYLLGSFNQANETLFKNETRDRQQSTNALVALAMTRLFDPHTWYRDIVDDILKIGDKLNEANLKNLPEATDEDTESVRNYLLPVEIDRDFKIGVNKITIDVDEEAVSGKLNDLIKILEEFFAVNSAGIYRKDQLILPIWQEDNAYFTMDPQGKQNGTATVYWFINMQSLSDLLVELSDKSDNDFFIDGIMLENVYFESEKIPEEFITDDKWYNFLRVTDGIWKIDCNVPLNDQMFNKENHEKQSAAVSIITIIFSKVYEPRHWTTEILDEVTITGDKLHTRSAARLDENRSFHPNEIILEFFLANRRIELSMQDCVEAGTMRGRSPKIQNINKAIEKFFKKFLAGVLTLTPDKNFAIWTYEDCFYCFEPGLTLMRFENDTLMADQMLLYADQDSDFEITSVEVLDWNKLPPWKFDPSPAVRPSNLPPLNAYSKLPGKARAILRGFTHEAAEIFPDGIRGHQTASNCIISLAMALIKNPTTWTRKTLDEILAIGVNLHRESSKFTTNVTTPKPKDIVRIFHIGVNVLAVDVETVLSGIVANPPEDSQDKNGKGKRNPKKRSSIKKDSKKKKGKRAPPTPPPPILLEEGLDKFFENNHAGILVTGRYMIALWKDSGVYFMYDPRSRNAKGSKDDDNEDGTSCVIWFACKEPLYDLISANINDDEKFAKFEICRVIVKTIAIESLPLPAGYKAINEAIPSREKSDCPHPPILPADLRRRCSKEELNVDLETSFEDIDKELSILLGGTHMSDRRFSAENRGYQSTAIGAVAAVVASLHAPSTWTAELIDAILKYGDGLHTECARLSNPGSRNLSPSELLTTFVVGDVRARIRVQRNFTAGISLESDLASSLKLFFDKNSSGIMHTATYALPVIEHWGKYYLLDPSDRNRFRKNSFDGTACLIKCDNVLKMAKVIVYLCAFKEPTVYTLNAVQILDLRFFTR